MLSLSLASILQWESSSSYGMQSSCLQALPEALPMMFFAFKSPLHASLNDAKKCQIAVQIVRVVTTCYPKHCNPLLVADLLADKDAICENINF